ncbi:MAG: endonuclease/exonuclease/phosphatase family protein [Myxococcales bacterium]|nr:endonuclease/exonuclease/phosphatase family protein [Myxococcales bacterium]
MPPRFLTRLGQLGVLFALLALQATALAAPESVYNKDNRRFHRSSGFSYATFNVQNLYRNRPVNDSPTRGGQPKRQNWMPSSDAAYRDKLRRVASHILRVGAPDIVGLQEIENFKRSTKLKEKSVLFALVGEIKRQSAEAGEEIVYNFAHTPGDSDRRGISNGFIYRADRVKLAEKDPNHPMLGRRPTDPYKRARKTANPKSFDAESPSSIVNDGQGRFMMSRPMLLGHFEIYKDRVGEGAPEELYVLNNHFKSNPALFQRRRSFQASLNASIVKQLLGHNSKANIIVAGDMNADYNNDDHKVQISPLETHTPSVNGAPNLLNNLTARLNKSDRFSYHYRGNDQLLDWIYASSDLSSRVVDIRIDHTNTKGGDEAKVSSDHDPVVARFKAFESTPASAQ